MRHLGALGAAFIVVLSAPLSAAHSQVTPVSFAERRDVAVAGSPIGITTGDYNGDGNPDIAAANNDVEAISILFGNGLGSFERREVELGSVLLGLSKIVTADVNGDGVPDLITSNELGNSVTVLINKADGSGTFEPPRFTPVGQSPEGVAVGFFDADDILDIATADQFDARVSVLLGNGDGSFGSAIPIAVAGSPYGLASGVLGGGPRADLAVTAFNESVAPLLWGDGEGAFTPGERLSVEESPIDVVVGDFNNDQLPDIAVVNFDSFSVSVLRGLGDRMFSAAQNYAVGDLPMALAAADLNGDGAIDLITADSFGSGAFFNSISVLLGRGNGAFVDPALAFEVGNGPWGVAVADFNRDGAPDIATANVESDTDPDAGSVSVLFQCVGDCNADGRVSADELVIGLQMALDLLPASACPTFDRNGDERVTVNDLVSAVNSALNVCAG